MCNCDKDDEVWRYDGDFLDDKDTLPVSEVRLGRTENTNKNGRYLLGAVQCIGMINGEYSLYYNHHPQLV